MGLAKGIITSKPEEYLHRHSGVAHPIKSRFADWFLMLTCEADVSATPGHPESHLRNKPVRSLRVCTGVDTVQHKLRKNIRKPALVPRTERPVMGLHSGRDCVHANAKEIIR